MHCEAVGFSLMYERNFYHQYVIIKCKNISHQLLQHKLENVLDLKKINGLQSYQL